MSKFVLSILMLCYCGTGLAKANKLVIYSSYDGNRLGPIFAPFTERTGIQVEVIAADSKALVQRLETEGASTPADLYLDKDMTFLSSADSKGLLQRFEAASVAKDIPPHLVDSNHKWFLVFYRARTIMYNTEKVSAAELSTYQDLGDSRWKGQLCLRTSNNSYNEALSAFLVKHLGSNTAEKVLSSWVANLAVDPIKGDTDLIKAIADGTCTVGIANTYYLAPLVRDNANFPVRPFFPNQNDLGAHVNGVGVGITAASKNLVESNMLLKYLASKEVQEAVASAFSQYPSNRTASINPVLTSFGEFREDTTNVGEVAKFATEGVELMKKVGYK